MINQIVVPDMETRVDLIRAVVNCAAEPWKEAANWGAVGEALGITPAAARGRYRRLVEYLEGNGWTIEQFATQEASDIEAEEGTDFTNLLIQMGYDPTKFRLKPRKVWTSGGKPQYSFEVEAVLKSDEKPIQEFVNKILAGVGPNKKAHRTPIPTTTNYMAVFNLADAHIGKRCLDGQDAEAVYRRVLEALIQELYSTQYLLSKVVLVVGQDFANFDNVHGATTQGTPQDNAIGWRELVTTQISILEWAVETLLEHFGTVDLCFVAGNHDVMNNFWLMQYAAGRYKEQPHVNIFGEGEWAVIRHGGVGIMMLHGDTGKADEYTDLWATIAPKVWANTAYREIHAGHFHTRKELVSEKHGVVIRYMPGLTGLDQWHRSKLYVGNNRLGLVTIYSEQHPVGEFYAFV